MYNMENSKWNFKKMIKNIDKTIRDLNTSKIFAGLMIITLNISSRFVNIKLSKSMEGYLKYTFSKQILIFAIVWMGTRDIYTSFGIVILFTILTEYLWNEESEMCCLSDDFKSYHMEKVDGDISDEDIKKAKEVLEKAEKNEKEKQMNSFNSNSNSTFNESLYRV